MANTLGNYNPEFYAQEALIQLWKALGMAGRVHRGAERERNAAGNQKGDTVNMKRPTKFTAAEHVVGTGTTTQDVVGENIAIVLNQHQEVKYKLTDRELAYTSEQIITDHIGPAAYALADKIDQDLHTLGAKIGPKAIITSIAASAITGPRKVLRNNEVPMDAGMIHYLVDAGVEAAFLDLGIFHEARITGDGANQAALMNGSLGQRFGVEVFASQNADVAGTIFTSTATDSADGGDRIGAVNNTGGYAANVSTMLVDGFAVGVETVQIGDTFSVAGDVTIYTLTADASLAAGDIAISFYPALRRNTADGAVVTFVLLNSVEEAANTRNLMFHRNAFALAFAPLPMTGDGKGAVMATVTDEVSGLSVRARMWYDGATASNYVALDALYGTQVLDPMLAVAVKRVSTLAPS